MYLMNDYEDVWAALEDAPDYADGVASLYSWSTNYGSERDPFTLFLDMIGWSEDNIGEALYPPVSSSLLGYMELDKLADALKEYTNRPHDVRAYVDTLMELETH